MKFNTKTKRYIDGTSDTIYCSRSIFDDKADEKLIDDFCNPVYDYSALPPFVVEQNDNQIAVIDTYTGEVHDTHQYNDNELRIDSIKRSRDKIMDIVVQNPQLKLFITGTFSSKKVDRENIDLCVKKIRNWLEYMRKLYALEYIIVPEYHTNGKAIHIHGVISDVLPKKDSGHKLKDGRTIYNLITWKNGFSTAIYIDDSNGRLPVGRYISKYLTKDLKLIFGKSYWSSKGLRRDTDIELSHSDFVSVPKQQYGNPLRAFKYDLQVTDRKV